MIARVLEPEVMESPDEAAVYDAMDHGAVNSLFVADFLNTVSGSPQAARLRDGVNPLRVLDIGTGTAHIPILIGREPVFTQTTALDASEEMLKLARRNIYASGLHFSIRLQAGDAKALPFPDASFAAVISNSIVHHLPEPVSALAEMKRVLLPGGVLFIRDLLRPASEEEVARLVQLYAGNETASARQLFEDSLRAALTLDEVAAMLEQIDLPADWVSQTSDRHWTISGALSEA